MAIIVGTNSYATSSELEAYASARGVEIAGDPDVLLIKAMDYLETLESRWQGERTDPIQPLGWPRVGVVVRGVSVADDAIPDAIVTAQIRLALEANAGVALLPTIKAQQSGAVTSKSVGDVSVGYSEGTSNLVPVFTWLGPLLGQYYRIGGGMNFAVSRA